MPYFKTGDRLNSCDLANNSNRNSLTISNCQRILQPAGSKPARVREIGGGQKRIEEQYPGIQEHIRHIVEDNACGSPEKILSWTTDSLRGIERKLAERYGQTVPYGTVGSILEDRGYRRHANQDMLQIGNSHPDRNVQFEFINGKAEKYIKAGEPVVWVDIKQKEKTGKSKNSGREYHNGKDLRKVLGRDFPIKELGKIAPYGVYCQNSNTGFVDIRTSRNTADFAVESITRWWHCVGKHTFPRAAKLLIICNCGGCKRKFWLAQLAAQAGLNIHVCHFPPGISKWNELPRPEG